MARNGVFSIRLGERDQAIHFWDEVANGSVTSSLTVFWHDSSFEQGRPIRKAETSTSQGLFVTENAEQPLVAAIRLLAGLCLEIQRDSEQFMRWAGGVAAERLEVGARLDYPSNLDAAQFVVKKLARSAYLRWSVGKKKKNWFVALRPNRGNSITDPAQLDLNGFTDVPLPEGVDAMADPFLWEAGGRQYLLFEEVAKGQSRGRLGCVEVLQNGSCSEMKILLERPYHLSYPCVVPSDGELFLLPETSEAKRIDLYRFSRFPWELELVASPIEGVALVDTTPISVDGLWYIFTTTTEPFMETLLFSATRLEGPWSLHPGNPISTSVLSCRSAGHLFWRQGRLFRTTQDCSVRYGYGITVNEVTKLTPHEFEEHLVCQIPPTWAPGLLGTHTWNESSAFQVIDGIRYGQ
ncbi:glucosamine inositolphosphorylceramide transferase family protein [Paludibaculum fermentans]|uniref:glucosamine inositolphosphorylceramide transferase family protein n=1 Tax=Paludibaculum fermentans TaxID=1473598 RepID=UPI003EBBD907